MDNELFKIGDKVYSIKTPEEWNYRKGHFKPPRSQYPQEKKISQVVKTWDGKVLYQVNGFHFTNDDIGKIIFLDINSACKALIEP